MCVSVCVCLLLISSYTGIIHPLYFRKSAPIFALWLLYLCWRACVFLSFSFSLSLFLCVYRWVHKQRHRHFSKRFSTRKTFSSSFLSYNCSSLLFDKSLRKRNRLKRPSLFTFSSHWHNNHRCPNMNFVEIKTKPWNLCKFQNDPRKLIFNQNVSVDRRPWRWFC